MTNKCFLPIIVIFRRLSQKWSTDIDFLVIKTLSFWLLVGTSFLDTLKNALRSRHLTREPFQFNLPDIVLWSRERERNKRGQEVSVWEKLKALSDFDILSKVVQRFPRFSRTRYQVSPLLERLCSSRLLSPTFISNTQSDIKFSNFIRNQVNRIGRIPIEFGQDLVKSFETCYKLLIWVLIFAKDQILTTMTSLSSFFQFLKESLFGKIGSLQIFSTMSLSRQEIMQKMKVSWPSLNELKGMLENPTHWKFNLVKVLRQTAITCFNVFIHSVSYPVKTMQNLIKSRSNIKEIKPDLITHVQTKLIPPEQDISSTFIDSRKQEAGNVFSGLSEGVAGIESSGNVYEENKNPTILERESAYGVQKETIEILPHAKILISEMLQKIKITFRQLRSTTVAFPNLTRMKNMLKTVPGFTCAVVTSAVLIPVDFGKKLVQTISYIRDFILYYLFMWLRKFSKKGDIFIESFKKRVIVTLPIIRKGREALVFIAKFLWNTFLKGESQEEMLERISRDPHNEDILKLLKNLDFSEIDSFHKAKKEGRKASSIINSMETLKQIRGTLLRSKKAEWQCKIILEQNEESAKELKQFNKMMDVLKEIENDAELRDQLDKSTIEDSPRAKEISLDNLDMKENEVAKIDESKNSDNEREHSFADEQLDQIKNIWSEEQTLIEEGDFVNFKMKNLYDSDKEEEHHEVIDEPMKLSQADSNNQTLYEEGDYVDFKIENINESDKEERIEVVRLSRASSNNPKDDISTASEKCIIQEDEEMENEPIIPNIHELNFKEENGCEQNVVLEEEQKEQIMTSQNLTAATALELDPSEFIKEYPEEPDQFERKLPLREVANQLEVIGDCLRFLQSKEFDIESYLGICELGGDDELSLLKHLILELDLAHVIPSLSQDFFGSDEETEDFIETLILFANVQQIELARLKESSDEEIGQLLNEERELLSELIETNIKFDVMENACDLMKQSFESVDIEMNETQKKNDVDLKHNYFATDKTKYKSLNKQDQASHIESPLEFSNGKEENCKKQLQFPSDASSHDLLNIDECLKMEKERCDIALSLDEKFSTHSEPNEPKMKSVQKEEEGSRGKQINIKQKQQVVEEEVCVQKHFEPLGLMEQGEGNDKPVEVSLLTQESLKGNQKSQVTREVNLDINPMEHSKVVSQEREIHHEKGHGQELKSGVESPKDESKERKEVREELCVQKQFQPLTRKEEEKSQELEQFKQFSALTHSIINPLQHSKVASQEREIHHEKGHGQELKSGVESPKDESKERKEVREELCVQKHFQPLTRKEEEKSQELEQFKQLSALTHSTIPEQEEDLTFYDSDLQELNICEQDVPQESDEPSYLNASTTKEVQDREAVAIEKSKVSTIQSALTPNVSDPDQDQFMPTVSQLVKETHFPSPMEEEIQDANESQCKDRQKQPEKVIIIEKKKRSAKKLKKSNEKRSTSIEKVQKSKNTTVTKGEKSQLDDEAKPPPRRKKKLKPDQVTEKKVEPFETNRENAYFQNLIFTRPAYTIVMEKRPKTDNKDYSSVLRKEESTEVSESDEEVEEEEIEEFSDRIDGKEEEVEEEEIEEPSDRSDEKDEEITEESPSTKVISTFSGEVCEECVSKRVFHESFSQTDAPEMHEIGVQDMDESIDFIVSDTQKYVGPVTYDKALSPLTFQHGEISTQTDDLSIRKVDTDLNITEIPSKERRSHRSSFIATDDEDQEFASVADESEMEIILDEHAGFPGSEQTSNIPHGYERQDRGRPRRRFRKTGEKSERPRSRVSVVRSPSSIDISIPIDMEDTDVSLESWERFAKAVQETTDIFEKKLVELSHRFNLATEESDIDLDLFEGDDLEASWDSNINDLRGHGANSSLTDYYRPTSVSHSPRLKNTSEDASPDGAKKQRPLSSVLDYSSLYMDKPFRYRKQGRSSLSQEPQEEDHRPRSSRSPGKVWRDELDHETHKFNLTRTFSVKTTARERLNYDNPYRRRGYHIAPPPPMRPHSAMDYSHGSQHISFHASSPTRTRLDTSKERELIHEMESENLERRKLTRSLRVANLRPEWRRSTIHTSQPYSPIKNYHRIQRKMSERRLYQSSVPVSYRRSLENLEKESRQRRESLERELETNRRSLSVSRQT